MDREIKDLVVGTILGVFQERFGLNPRTIRFDDRLDKIVPGNKKMILSHALLDIHMLLDVEVQYEVFHELDFFETMQDVSMYFYQLKIVDFERE